jgi:hypothetical protein
VKVVQRQADDHHQGFGGTCRDAAQFSSYTAK